MEVQQEVTTLWMNLDILLTTSIVDIRKIGGISLFGLKNFFRRLKGKMSNSELSSVTDHTEIKNLDLTMLKKIGEWREYYEGKEDVIKYTTATGAKTRPKKSLRMSKIVTSQMASLIFNERCSININDENTNKYINGVLRNSQFYSVFQTYLEYMLALGGLVLKPYYDFDRGVIRLSYVTADSFVILSKKNGQVQDIVFMHDLTIDREEYLHLEFHLTENKQRLVRNELYKKVGSGYKRANLAKMSEDLEAEVVLDDFNRNLFVYIKPNIANNIKLQSVEGISIFANSIDTLDMIDSAFDSLINEFKLGKKRIMVSSELIKEVVDPATGLKRRYFDTEDEAYEVFNRGSDLDGNLFKEVEMELRVEEHVSALNALLDVLSEQTGFNVGTFTVNKNSVKTATEVISENSKTFKSKQSHEIVIEEGLKELVEIILDLSEYYDVYERGTTELEMVVKFDDSIVEDYGTDIEHQVKMLTNKIQTRKNSIMKLHKVTAKEAERIMKEIDEDTSAEIPPN